MKTNRMSAAAATVLMVLLLSGCATASSSGSRRSQDLITRDEIESLQVSTLYEVVQRLRPRWLEVRSVQTFGAGTGTNAVVVYQGQTLLGGVDVLRQLDPSAAESLRYLDGSTASASLPGIGSRHIEGAIVIQTVGN